jgi:hypothetical protein
LTAGVLGLVPGVFVCGAGGGVVLVSGEAV